MSFKYWQSALDTRLHSLEKTLRQDGIEPAPRLVRMQLELEVRAMRSTLSQVYQKLNELSYANTLPSSVLQRIFLILSAYEPVPNHTWTTRARESNHWTKVLDVCRSYRKAALACPQLWVSPPLNLGSARFYAFMARSRDSPIDLHLADAGELPALLLCEALQEPEDIARIRILDSSVPLGNEALQALTGSAPILETLRIAPPGLLEEPRVMSLPENILSGQAPRLRVLALRGFSTFFTQTAILSNVVSLNISRGVETSAYTRPTWAALRILLGGLLSIEELTLHGCLPEPLGRTTEPLEDGIRALNPPPIDLLHLRKVDVSGEFKPVVRFFNDLSLRPTCVLHIKIQDPSSKMYELTDALSACGLFPAHEESRPLFRSMRVLTCPVEGKRAILQIEAFPGVEAYLGFGEPYPFVLEVEHVSELRTLEVLANLRLPVQTLCTLYLGANVAVSSERLVPLPAQVQGSSPDISYDPFAFSNCAQLTAIYTEGSTAKSLIKALQHPTFFPSLQRLTIARDLNFEEDYKEELMITWKVFYRTLTGRKDAGCPIGTVILPSDTLKEYWVERLEDTGVAFEAVEDIDTGGSQGERPSLSQLLSITEDGFLREY